MKKSKCCTKCKIEKEIPYDFYLCKDRYQSRCKACVIKYTVLYNKSKATTKKRYGDDETKKKYWRQYYANNIERFAIYRKRFLERHPDYYKKYYQKLKDKKK